MIARLRRLLLILAFTPLAACAAGDSGLTLAEGRGSMPVYVVSDGWHTGLVLPRGVLRGPWPEQAGVAASRYVEVGWGDKAMYLAEQGTTRLVWGAAFGSTGSAMRVAPFDVSVAQQFAGFEVLEVRLAPRALDELSRFVAASFAHDRDGKLVLLTRKEADLSAFYLSTGRYHAFNTCNTWVARALRMAGCPIHPILTLTAAQLMHQVRSFARPLAPPPVSLFGGGLDMAS
jgi:uncharacterized protein (TIGR02117 family)